MPRSVITPSAFFPFFLKLMSFTAAASFPECFPHHITGSSAPQSLLSTPAGGYDPLDF